MEWEELRQSVYRRDGSLRDIYVLQASRVDWQTWITLVNAQYPVQWQAEDYNNGVPLDRIDADFVARRWDTTQYVTAASINLNQVKVQCHFFIESEIEQDIAPQEIQTLEDHQRLMAYLVAVSTALGKEVIVTEEMSEEEVWIRVNDTASPSSGPYFS